MPRAKTYYKADPADVKALKDLRAKDAPLKAKFLALRDTALSVAAEQQAVTEERQKLADEITAKRDALLKKGYNPADL